MLEAAAVPHHNPTTLSTAYAAAAAIADAGIVRTQATTIVPATPHRTPRVPRLGPTPMIALEMTCVVETGMPSCAVVSRTVAAVVSAAKPLTGSSSTTRWPIVFMIRQPPTAVPSEIAVAATTITHGGTSTLGIAPAE